MGWCVVPKPGTKAGPCVGECKHIDCAATRADAAKICRHCGKPIGYETAYYADGPVDQDFSKLKHAVCTWNAVVKGKPGGQMSDVDDFAFQLRQLRNSFRVWQSETNDVLDFMRQRLADLEKNVQRLEHLTGHGARPE